MAKPKINLIILSIFLVIIVGFISYKTYENFQILECSSIKNCKTCSGSFGCVWCIGTKKCVSDLSSNRLCPGESTASNPAGCDAGSLVDSSGANINSPLFGGKCSNNKSCDTCLKSPDCTWCNNLQICAGSVELYQKCKDDPTLYNSLYQCSLRKVIEESSGSNPFNPVDTVIPTIGLSRNTDGSLTVSSLQIIFNSFASKGNPIQDIDSKNYALNQIIKELRYYKNQYKTNLNTYLDNSIDYVNDPKSLNDAKITDQHIQDLKDVSRFINNYNVNRMRPDITGGDFSSEFWSTNVVNEGFTPSVKESFVDTYTSHLQFDNVKQQNSTAKMQIQAFYFFNLVALGTLFYFMNIN
jgi:hypothetical protein